MSEQIVVMGQVARDLVLGVDHVPDHFEAVPAADRLEMLGGKGANQAVGLVQLGVPAALLTSVLVRGGGPEEAAELGAAAAAVTVGHLGGRPDLARHFPA